MVEDKIILGIDPGTMVLGYGLIHVKGSKMHMLNCGVIDLKNYQPIQINSSVYSIDWTA